jgi:hypothetical protein
MKKLLFELYRAMLDRLPARLHAVIGYLRVHRRLPNLREPHTFTEKIVWRKLYERDPRLPALVDKVLVKEHIAQRYGADLIIPTLAVYADPDEMDFGKPPLSEPPYVIKANHGWAMNFFVHARADLEIPGAIESLRRTVRGWLATDHSRRMREWAYSQVQRRILVEPYVGTMNDFKLHVFHGKVFACELIAHRFAAHRQEAVYDRSWKVIDANYGFPLYAGPLPPRGVRSHMIALAESIGRDFSYVRVDLYVVEGKLKFGELTFYPGGGEEKLQPEKWDRIFGAQWQLGGGATRQQR